MIDGIPKLTGNSYLAKGSLPATYAELKAAFESGTQGLDLIFNAAGWQAVGTVLSKANLLSDATAAAIKTLAKQSSAPSTPTAALSALVTAITATNTAVAGGAKIATGSYVGTGTYGADNPCVLTFDFVPQAIMIFTNPVRMDSHNTFFFLLKDIPVYTVMSHYTYYTVQTGTVSNTGYVPQILTVTGHVASWFGTPTFSNLVSCDSSPSQLNTVGVDYHYIAIG